MLSPSKPLHAAGDVVQLAPASSLKAIVAQFGWPFARKLTLKMRPVRASTSSTGSRLETGPAGETSSQRVKSVLEGRTAGCRSAPLGEPARHPPPRDTSRPSPVEA